ncbi:leucine rich repeat domain containing protein [Acanthamoeba castellanii str. Neff]|uniref:Leucine rich repeat domain containing protein n=1 Tax=Acanthamoeba castellanii (strain ATCC 30010 / Neff) TaxID=1257118 RepID=L8HH87_ACACF|nr:leucine rich repeat domain containing protein [Acanthamoeba castellanii str. Neff]ELR24048.1 leucine rich repeat domain containing protein [Acanthamoeba castellanii str. Neff]
MSSSSSNTRLSLAYRDLEEVAPSVLAKYAATLIDLDLSNNRLTEVSFLRGLGALETLVLDGNRLTHQVRFPPLGRLQTLWVNRNAIGLLPTFVDRLAEAVPRLRFLSMLGNQACPNYLNGGTLKQYRDYRLFVLSRLRHLDMLDDAPVTEEERGEATRLYGNLDVSGAEAMYKRQTLDQGNATEKETAAADEQKRETAAKEEEGQQRKGSSSTAGGRRRKAAASTKAGRMTKNKKKEDPAATAASVTDRARKDPPVAEAAKPEEPAMASTPEKQAPPVRDEADVGVGAYVVDDLPDPLLDLPRDLPPPPGALRRPGSQDQDNDEEEDESDWTDDDSDDEREVSIALDLPDFSSSSDE